MKDTGILGKTLLWMWQAPQNFIAFMCWVFFKNLSYVGTGEYKGKVLICGDKFLSSFSLGDYIFLTPYASDLTIQHEYGHCKQSMLLGCLYLPVIIIPSLLHKLYITVVRKLGFKPHYYQFYTERWADKLAGLERE